MQHQSLIISNIMKSIKVTDYERNQKYNFLVSFIHGIRYKYLLEYFRSLSEKMNSTIKVVEIGCAHAKAFSVINKNFDVSYTGIELNNEFVDVALERYGSCPNFEIICDSIENQYDKLIDADIILALETLEHIPENLVVRIIEQIARAKPKAFLCSVPNEVGPIVLVKNLCSLMTGYIRHKEYSWKKTVNACFYRLDKIETHTTGHKGFDWRWLAQTLRHNMKITKTYSSPFKYLPKTFSFSIVFFCEPNQ